MRLWWTLWSGHVVLAVMIVFAFLTGYFMWQVFRSIAVDDMFVYFVLAALSFLITVIVGIIAAWRWKTWGERRYIRREEDLLVNALEPAGRVDLGDTPRSTGVPFAGVSAAQVADERGISSDQ